MIKKKQFAYFFNGEARGNYWLKIKPAWWMKRNESCV